jgi:hypothetical protein
MLMAAQIRVPDLDREAILPQAVAEILSQSVGDFCCNLWPKVFQQRVEVFERS